MIEISGPKPPVTVRIYPELIYQVKLQATLRRISIGDWLAEAITEKMAREQSNANPTL